MLWGFDALLVGHTHMARAGNTGDSTLCAFHSVLDSGLLLSPAKTFHSFRLLLY